MIKIVLKGDDQVELLANVSFYKVKEFLDYGTDLGDWLAAGDYIVPVDQIRYIVDMGGNKNED